MDNKHREEETVISISELWRIIKQHRKALLFGSLVSAALFSSYTLLKPIAYEAEGTFREKNKTQAGLSSSSLVSMFLNSSSSGGNSEAVATLRSRRFLEPVVQEMGLQATVSKIETGFPKLANIRDRLKVEYALFKKKPIPAIPDPAPALRAEHVVYEGEVPLALELRFQKNRSYEAIGPDRKSIGYGTLGEPFSANGYAFVLRDQTAAPKAGERYALSLSPLASTASSLGKQLKIEPDKDDSSLLKIKLLHRDRNQGCAIVNGIMRAYQVHLKKEHDKIASAQIHYLEKREKVMGDKLERMMAGYADTISSEVTHVGCASMEKAIEFLSHEYQRNKQKLFEIDLETRRLAKALQEGIETVGSSQPVNIPEAIRLSEEIRHLKQQSDELELAVRSGPDSGSESANRAYFTQSEEVERLHLCGKEAETLMEALQRENIPRPTPLLFENSGFVVRNWHEKLVEAERQYRTAPIENRASKKEERRACLEHFKIYLTNLQHYLQVKEKAVKERLNHQQAPQSEFQGINLETANALYISYSRELSSLQAEIAQLGHTLEQMGIDDYELSSLGAVLHDEVSRSMIAKASDLVLTLQDDVNRSAKEQERVKRELSQQQNFLKIHIEQTLQLLSLKEQLLKDKVFALQNAALALTRQHISVLENELGNYLVARLNHLNQERDLIQQHQEELQKEMALLPEKWVSEKMVEQYVKMNQAMVEEVTKLVESKNISHNLELVQSAPVDIALPSIHPITPRLFLFAIGGAIFGAFITFTFLAGRSILIGVKATQQNLELNGAHVAGEISPAGSGPLSDGNLETCRRILSRLFKPHQAAVMLSAAKNDYSAALAALLSKKGCRALLISLDFENGSEPGLLQYLSGELEEPRIKRGKDFDALPSGGITRFSLEHLSSEKFQRMLERLQSDYDWVIASSPASPTSAEGEFLFHHFPAAIINVRDETVSDLSKFFAEGKTASFVIIKE